MDAFFASVEQRDNPEYRGKPLIVAGPSKRGVVSAASYEARKFGIRSAMATSLALRKCPRVINAAPRFAAYKEASDRVMEIFREYTDLVEPISIDEAFLDVTENKPGIESATIIAEEIRSKIFERTGLTASAGVSFVKVLAKIASDFDKPDGLTVVPPARAQEFADALDVRKFPGIGPVTEEKLHKLGIYKGKDLRAQSEDFLRAHFGKVGTYFHKVSRNLYDPPVAVTRERKSIGAERTFGEDSQDEEVLLAALEKIADKLSGRMRKKGVKGKTVTLKIKYYDFEVHTRGKTLDFFACPDSELITVLKILFKTPIPPQKPVRLLGASVSALQKESEIGEQLALDFGA